jgi:hypothetical protein
MDMRGLAPFIDCFENNAGVDQSCDDDAACEEDNYRPQEPLCSAGTSNRTTDKEGHQKVPHGYALLTFS